LIEVHMNEQSRTLASTQPQIPFPTRHSDLIGKLALAVDRMHSRGSIRFKDPSHVTNIRGFLVTQRATLPSKAGGKKAPLRWVLHKPAELDKAAAKAAEIPIKLRFDH
jgi:hypothetical protein